MNHPQKENWMAFLYGELPPDQQADLQSHLHVCPVCKASVERWREAMRGLDEWKLPATRVRQGVGQTVLKWGLAASILLGAGIGLGRWSAPRSPGLEELHGALVPSVREELRRELSADLQAALSDEPRALTNEYRLGLREGFVQLASDTVNLSRAETAALFAEFIRTYNEDREQDRRSSLALYEEAERRRLLDFALLRQDIETMAVVGERRLQQAQNDIGLLASYAQSAAGNETAIDGATPVTHPNRKGN